MASLETISSKRDLNVTFVSGWHDAMSMNANATKFAVFLIILEYAMSLCLCFSSYLKLKICSIILVNHSGLNMPQVFCIKSLLPISIRKLPACFHDFFRKVVVVQYGFLYPLAVHFWYQKVAHLIWTVRVVQPHFSIWKSRDVLKGIPSSILTLEFTVTPGPFKVFASPIGWEINTWLYNSGCPQAQP